METGGGQSSSSASSLDKMNSSLQNDQMTKLVRIRDVLENQIKIFQEFLDQPSENANVLLKTIAAILKKSNENSTEDIDAHLTEIESLSVNKNHEIIKVVQLRKVLNTVKQTIEAFSVLKDQENDENLCAVLAFMTLILENGKISALKEDGGNLSLLLSSSSPEMVTHHENEEESNAKRQKVILDSETNENTIPKQLFRKEENPLENHVVLKNLFKYVDEEDLFPLRLVSRQWNCIATSSLKKRDCCLKFTYNSGVKTYIKTGSTSETLHKFNDILSMSTDFPIVKFEFCKGDLGSSEAQEFFKSYGKKIKGISFALNNGGDEHMPHTSVHIFKKILLVHTKNVKQLELHDIPEEWSEDSSFQLFPEPRNMIQLPQITSFITNNNFKFTTAKSLRLVQDIIQAAVNLKEITGYKIDYLDPTASAFENKIHILKYIHYEPTEKNLELYSKFAEGKPKLDNMEISLAILNNNNTNNNTIQLKKKVIETLQKIFESSKDTLTCIDNWPPLSHLPRLKFPSMRKIKKIVFADHEDFSIFNWISVPQEDLQPLQLAQTFPCLNSVTMDFVSPGNSELWLNYFDYSQPLYSVKTLVANNETSPRFLEKLAGLFPAVETVEIKMNNSEYLQTMPIIWKGFSNVKELTIENYKDDDGEIKTERMDSGICGFPPETCIQLKNNSRNVKLEDVEALRENPSILDAKKLTTFKILMKFGDEEDEEVISGPIFSIVTGIFGFGLVKKQNGVKIDFQLVNAYDENMDIGIPEIAYYINEDDDAE